MTKKDIRNRLTGLERYLNQNWPSIGYQFTERLIARIEYDKLLEKLKEAK